MFGIVAHTGGRLASAAFNIALTAFLVWAAIASWTRSADMLSMAGGLPPREVVAEGPAVVLAWIESTLQSVGTWQMAAGYAGAWVLAIVAAGCGWLALLGTRTVVLAAFRAASRMG